MTKDELIQVVAEVMTDHDGCHTQEKFPELYYVCSECSKSVEAGPFSTVLELELWHEEHVAEEIINKLTRLGLLTF